MKGFLDKDTPPLEIDSCTPTKTRALTSSCRRGAEHYQRGEVLYLQGDYQGAVLELVASYCEIPYYSILKDIGQAYERELEYAKAIAYCERYVLDMPKDAQKTSACAPDPQDDKQNVTRVSTSSAISRAKIRVQTVPPDARVSIVQNNKIVTAGSSGTELEVVGGPYTLIVERRGYHTIALTSTPRSASRTRCSSSSSRSRSPAHSRVTPGDARVFLDKRRVGTGIYETSLPGGKYTVQAEAPDRMAETGHRDRPEHGRHLRASTAARVRPAPAHGLRRRRGASAGALIASAQSSADHGARRRRGPRGRSAGRLLRHAQDLALGTSSLTVTSSLVGGVAGAALAAVVTKNRSAATRSATR